MSVVTLERVCEHCGQSFAPKRSHARFCSDRCRTAHGRGGRVSEPNANGSLRPQAIAKAEPAETPLTWEPAGEPRQPYQTGEPCPDCGDLLIATQRGTLRFCRSHRIRLPTKAVKPYERDGTTTARQVISQREKDLTALGLARRKGIMLTQFAQIAADNRLHPESVPAVDWYAAEVRAATTEARLTELANLAAGPDSGIRTRHWWQNRPAVITSTITVYADGDDLDYEDEDYEPASSGPQAIEAPAPGPAETNLWAMALDALGWRLHATPGGCQIVDELDELCGDQLNPHHVIGRHEQHAWICSTHFQSLIAIVKRPA